MKWYDVAFMSFIAFGPNKLCGIENVKFSHHLGSQFSASLPGSNSQHHSIHLPPEWKKMQPPLWVFTTFKWTGDQSSCESLRMWDAASRTFIRFYKLIQLKQPTQEHIRTEVQLCESTDELFPMNKSKGRTRHLWVCKVYCFIVMASIFLY